MKYCKTGDHWVELDGFNLMKKARDGRQSQCRECKRKIHKETWTDYYGRNREKRLENTKQWKVANPEKRAAIDKARYESLKADAEIPLDSDWRGVMYGFYGRKCMNPSCLSVDDLTIDHIVSIKAAGIHAYSNLQVLCRSCNSSKREHDQTDYRPWPRLLDRISA